MSFFVVVCAGFHEGFRNYCRIFFISTMVADFLENGKMLYLWCLKFQLFPNQDYNIRNQHLQHQWTTNITLTTFLESIKIFRYLKCINVAQNMINPVAIILFSPWIEFGGGCGLRWIKESEVYLYLWIFSRYPWTIGDEREGMLAMSVRFGEGAS
jgi:hypothetical protein